MIKLLICFMFIYFIYFRSYTFCKKIQHYKWLMSLKCFFLGNCDAEMVVHKWHTMFLLDVNHFQVHVYCCVIQQASIVIYYYAHRRTAKKSQPKNHS